VFFLTFFFFKKKVTKKRNQQGGGIFPQGENARIPLLDLPPVLAAPFTMCDWMWILEQSIGGQDLSFGFRAEILVLLYRLEGAYALRFWLHRIVR